jgi:hypothetical protein
MSEYWTQFYLVCSLDGHVRVSLDSIFSRTWPSRLQRELGCYYSPKGAFGYV